MPLCITKSVEKSNFGKGCLDQINPLQRSKSLNSTDFSLFKINKLGFGKDIENIIEKAKLNPNVFPPRVLMDLARSLLEKAVNERKLAFYLFLKILFCRDLILFFYKVHIAYIKVMC